MTPNTIFLRIGQRDRVALPDFIDSLKNFLGMLRDFDATISQEQRGSVIWEVVSLQQNSPPIVGVSPTPKRGMMDFSRTVEAQILQSTAEITLRGERSAVLSDAALDRLERLASKTKKLGSHSLYVNGDGQAKQETPITEKTYENAQRFTRPTFSNFGTITGRLQSISVHNGDEFRVWDETTGKPVRCRFDLSQDDLVRSLLRDKVVVSGEILSNSAGMPISLKLADLSRAIEHHVPTIDEIGRASCRERV